MTSLSEVFIPKFSQWTLDLLWGSPENHLPKFLENLPTKEALLKLCFAFPLVLIVGWLGRVGWRQSLARRTHIAGRDFRVAYWDSLRDLRESRLLQYTLGDLISRGISDLNAVRFLLGMTLVITFDVIFFVSFSLFFMFRIDAGLALACLAPSFFAVPLVIKFAKIQEKTYLKAQKKLSFFSEMISKALSMMKFSRATATEKIWSKHLYREATSYAKRSYKFQRSSWKLFPIVNIPTLISYIVLLILGPQRLSVDAISPGELLAFFSYLLLMQTPLYEINHCITEWQKGLVGLKRINEVMAVKNASARIVEADPLDIKRSLRAVQAGDLSYGYGEGSTVLQNLNFTIKKGEIIGITGPVGSGKSTLVKILSQEITGYQGSLCLFGEELSTLSPQHISTVVNCVPQKPFLFAGTIRHNLCLDSIFTEEQLKSILNFVGLYHELQQAGRSLDSWIGEWGVSLSGGQKQRLCLARALLRPKPLLLLDDSFSAVDSITEKNIIERIGEVVSSETTIVWVAHRSSTLKYCSRILTLENGVISE